MKLNQSITHQLVQQFGEAQLLRHPNGRHELVGGSIADLVAAKEWVSLFAHDIVFSRSFVTLQAERLVEREVAAARF
jgi:hypothetical protein